jgi:hypothetical protein
MAGSGMSRMSNNVVMENVEIGFRNFAGAEGEFNRKGDRNFAVFLEPEEAAGMESDGWNVKYLKVREEGDQPQAYLQVSVSYNPKARPPKIVMVTTRNKTPLGEDMVDMLDFVDIKLVDLILSPYAWSVSGKSGIKAYLQTMYITIEEDPLDLKYAEIGTSRQLESGFEPGYDVIQGEVIEDAAREIEF